MRTRTLLGALALASLACDKDETGDPADSQPATGDSTDSDAQPDDTGETGGETGVDDTAFTDPDPPCAAGSWGWIEDPEGAIHVRADGSDEAGDGRPIRALATIEAALALARERGEGQTIALGPGSYEASLDLVGEIEGLTDNGLSILGCGADDVELVAGDDAAPILRATAVQDLRLAGFTLRGGYRALWLWGGTGASVEGVTVSGSTRSGVVIDGPYTLVDVVGCAVEATVPDEDEGGVLAGYGVTIEDATVFIQGTEVSGSTRVGVLVQNANFEISDSSVTGTDVDGDGVLGRGIQLQGLSVPTLQGVNLTENQDAGLTSIQSLALVLDHVTVDATYASDVPDLEDDSGDGIVVGQGGEATTPIDVDLLQSQFTSCEVTGSARAGIVVEDVTAALNGNLADGSNGISVGGSSIFSQGGAVVSGADVEAGLVAARGEDPLGFYDVVIDLDELLE